MTPFEFISQFENPANFSKKSLVLIFGYYLRKESAKPEFSVDDIRNCFNQALIRPPANLIKVISDQASGRTSVLIRGTLKGMFSLSIHGMKEVEAALARKPTTQSTLSQFLEIAVPYLQRSIAKVKEEDRRAFLAEAIACIGVQARRATIIMTWVAVIDHLYEYILSKKLVEFNNALAQRRDRFASIVISSKDDFLDIRELVFIEVTRSAGIITNDVRKILEEKLGIRNTCAHPSTVVIHDTKVVNFIEDLIDNVVVKYPL